MNIINTQKKILKQVGGLELYILAEVNTYCNKDQYQRTITPTRYYMTGGRYGDHSISVDSSLTRVSAHWRGYLEANGVNTNELKVKEVYFF